MDVPPCPKTLPSQFTSVLRSLGESIMAWEGTPSVSGGVSAAWCRMLDAWIDREDLPMYVRQMRHGRGSVVTHRSGRHLIPVDNSTAHWALATALAGQCPTLDEIEQAQREDRIPIAMVLKKQERTNAKFVRTRTRVNLNSLGWKVCHIDGVKLPRGDVRNLPLKEIEAHFRRYLSPSNMFLVPLKWGGLGETPELCEAARGLRDRRSG